MTTRTSNLSVQSKSSETMSLGQARRSFTTDYEDENSLDLQLLSADVEEARNPSSSSSTANKNHNNNSTCFAPRCQCNISKFGCTATISAIVVVLAIAFLLLLNVVGPSLAQSSIKHSTLSLQSCVMRDADNKSIALDCHVRLDNAGSIGAILRAFPVEVLHVEPGGDTTPLLFGRMVMPETVVHANTPTLIRLTSRLNVTNNAEFTKATAGVLQGNVGTWLVRGDGLLDATMGGITARFHVHVEKEMLLPPTVLSNVTAFNFIVTGSDKNHVYAAASCSLLSVSVLELHSLGTMSFSLHAPLNGLNPGAYVGEITIQNFQVRRGYNQVS